MTEIDRVEKYIRHLIKRSNSVEKWSEEEFTRLVLRAYTEFLGMENEEIKRVITALAITQASESAQTDSP